jgi:hypothetical protein
MVNFTGSNGIDLSHLVVFYEDSKIFVSGRERFNRRIRIFLLDQRTGDIYVRKACTGRWVVLEDEGSSKSIMDNVFDACLRKHIPVYRVSGQFFG